MTITERVEEIQRMCARLEKLAAMSDWDYLKMINEKVEDVDCHASAEDGCEHCNAGN